MAAIDFSHFFLRMPALSYADADPVPDFDHDRRLHKHIAYANLYPNVSTTA